MGATSHTSKKSGVPGRVRRSPAPGSRSQVEPGPSAQEGNGSLGQERPTGTGFNQWFMDKNKLPLYRTSFGCYTDRRSICVRSSMDRASDSGSECWGFESLRAYHDREGLKPQGFSPSLFVFSRPRERFPGSTGDRTDRVPSDKPLSSCGAVVRKIQADPFSG